MSDAQYSRSQQRMSRGGSWGENMDFSRDCGIMEIYMGDQSRRQPDLANFVRARVISSEGLVSPVPENFVEPGRGFDYTPWHHTPNHPYDENTWKHQSFVKQQLEDLANHPPIDDLPAGFTDFVIDDLRAGFNAREVNAYTNFADWESKHRNELEQIKSDEELNWLYGEALNGHGNPGGLLKLLVAARSLRSIDLQALSTPFGYRREYAPAMQYELSEALRHHPHGTILPRNQKNYYDEPKISPVRYYPSNGDDKVPTALFLTHKRRVGFVYDGDKHPDDMIHVVERNSEVVRLDHLSELGRFAVSVLETEPVKVSDTDYMRMRDYLLERVERRDGVYRSSTTVYAFREEPQKD